MSSDNPRPRVLLVPVFDTAVRYFLQSDIVPTLLEQGAEVRAIAPVSPEVAARYEQMHPGLRVEPFDADGFSRSARARRLNRIRAIADVFLTYLIRLGMGGRMNTAVIDSTRPWLKRSLGQARIGFTRMIADAWIWFMRVSRPARKLTRAVANANLRTEQVSHRLAEIRPDLVVTAGLGWGVEEYAILREARKLGARTCAAMSGWDHTANRGIPRLIPDHTITWSAVQKQELIDGSDVPEETAEALGSAYFDRYTAPSLANGPDREEFFANLGLDPERRLVTFACTFVAISSNAEMVGALANAIANDAIGEPAHLLIRLHPGHMKSGGPADEIRSREVEFYRQLADTLPDVHIQEPPAETAPVSANRGTGGFDDTVALLDHTDVVVTLFSTMALEACIKNVPTVTAAVAPTGEWRWEYTWDISRALDWPTHERIIESGATIVAFTLDEMVEGVRRCLRDPDGMKDQRATFAIQEISSVDGNNGRRIGNRLFELSQLKRGRTS